MYLLTISDRLHHDNDPGAYVTPAEVIIAPCGARLAKVATSFIQTADDCLFDTLAEARRAAADRLEEIAARLVRQAEDFRARSA